MIHYTYGTIFWSAVMDHFSPERIFSLPPLSLAIVHIMTGP
jgi:hypothetical protein